MKNCYLILKTAFLYFFKNPQINLGTSTGALVAFSLVAGNKMQQGKCQKTVQEVLNMYKEDIPKIFHHFDGTGQGTTDRIIRWEEDLPTTPYKQDGLETILKEIFGDLTLADIKPDGNHQCIAAAVTRYGLKYSI